MAIRLTASDVEFGTAVRPLNRLNRDLKDGDELTMDYNIGIEDPPYYEVLCEQYEISEPWL